MTDDVRVRDAGDENALVDGADIFRRRWENIQAGFVDDPRKSVEKADALVGDLINSVSEGFTKRRQNLEEQWRSGQDVSTDDLRRGLQHYRSFFERLLSQSNDETTDRGPWAAPAAGTARA
jgi:hypothetical protein